jgi:hypothetical protein
MKDDHSNGAYLMLPSGSTCTFNGVEVPMFVMCSENGSITSQLITESGSRNRFLNKPSSPIGIGLVAWTSLLISITM